MNDAETFLCATLDIEQDDDACVYVWASWWELRGKRTLHVSEVVHEQYTLN